MKFRKKPVVIEAEQFNPDPARPRDVPAGVDYSGVSDLGDHHWSIRTLEGRMQVKPGDWIITGVKGEKYPCKPDIFELTYEEVTS